MIIELMGQILALCGFSLAGIVVHKLLRIDLTLSCLLVGFLIGIGLNYVDFDTGLRATNLKDLVFFIILPILVFEAAWHLKPTLLRQWILPIFLLATVGVLVSFVVSAIVIYIGIGHDIGFPVIAALLTAAILSATDPVAVIAQLKDAKAPADFTTLFEGESLFNDATAVVLFTLVIGFATGSTVALEGIEYVGFFSTVFFGGILTGVTVGLISVFLILLVGMSSATTLTLVITAFASFYVSEHVFHVSGIMSVMASALVVRFALKEVESKVAVGVANFWESMGLFFNSLLFIIMGIVTSLEMFEDQWLAMLIAIVASLLGRTAGVLISSKLSNSLSSFYIISWPRQKLLIWGGLRGAIAIALVLSIPTSLPYWWTIQSMVFGTVIFSLLVQGTTTKVMLKKLKNNRAE
jgi:CPA1 family monovalent cation:H+ antiporter